MVGCDLPPNGAVGLCEIAAADVDAVRGCGIAVARDYRPSVPSLQPIHVSTGPKHGKKCVASILPPPVPSHTISFASRGPHGGIMSRAQRVGYDSRICRNQYI